MLSCHLHPPATDGKGIRAHLLSGPNAHLFHLYPLLCDLSMLVAGRPGASPAAHQSAGVHDEEAVAHSLRQCMSKIGQVLGVE
jgi:hypothetical protein